LIAIASMFFHLNLAMEKIDRRLGNLAGIVVRVSADTESADDREPTRNRATGETLGDPDANPAQHLLGHPKRGAANQNALTDADDNFPQRLCSCVTEEAVKHLLPAKVRGLAKGARNVRHHLRLNPPDAYQVWNDCRVPERPWG
jgi:hypothetical protein